MNDGPPSALTAYAPPSRTVIPRPWPRTGPATSTTPEKGPGHGFPGPTGMAAWNLTKTVLRADARAARFAPEDFPCC